ncbi:MAG: lysophospholipid acyltransferase family protein [Planctomycetia bacterium]|nr:lysophospholipid acyltransferase family protein [Planctomycetia bacterium]
MSSDTDVARQIRRFRRISSLVGWMPRWMARAFVPLRTRWVLATGEFGKVREILEKNLEPVLPPGTDLAAAADRLLMNYGQFLMDYFRIPFMKASWIPRMFHPMVGVGHVEAALKAGKGAILATAHLGCWELGGVAMRLQGMPVTAVGVPDPANAAVTQWRDEVRQGHGLDVVTIDRGRMATLDVVRALDANRVVCMLTDRNFVESDPLELEFFGRRAKFPRGPALLSLTCGSPLIPAFVTLGRAGRYDAEVFEPVPAPKGGTKAERAVIMMQSLVRILEAKIRAHADQWYIFDPYWDAGEPVSNIARKVAGLEGGASPLK